MDKSDAWAREALIAAATVGGGIAGAIANRAGSQSHSACKQPPASSLLQAA